MDVLKIYNSKNQKKKKYIYIYIYGKDSRSVENVIRKE